MLLYSTETYTLYRHPIRKHSQVHLRRIPRISWKDYLPNIEVLKWGNRSSIEATLTASQLRWTGHVTRMNNSKLPKVVFFGELINGKRFHSGHRLRYKDVVK